MSKLSRQMAIGGLFSAVAVLILILGGLIGIGTLAAPLLAGIPMMIVYEKCGRKTSIIAWIASGILGLILSADKELAVLYLGFFGWYPSAKSAIESQFSPSVSRVIKLINFNSCIVILYVAMLFLLFGGNWELAGFGGGLMTALYLLAGNVIFFLYDRILDVAAKRAAAFHT